jgi:hypothetical protein
MTRDEARNHEDDDNEGGDEADYDGFDDCDSGAAETSFYFDALVTEASGTSIGGASQIGLPADRILVKIFPWMPEGVTMTIRLVDPSIAAGACTVIGAPLHRFSTDRAGCSVDLTSGRSADWYAFQEELRRAEGVPRMRSGGSLPDVQASSTSHGRSGRCPGGRSIAGGSPIAASVQRRARERRGGLVVASRCEHACVGSAAVRDQRAARAEL